MANIGYKRVSTVEQNTDRQLADCGIQFKKIFEDKASGKSTEGRPALFEMIDYIRDGDTVYVHSMDRLARNLEDLLHIVKLINDEGATLHFVTENLIFEAGEGNDTKGTGKFLLSILGAVAEFERKMIHQRQMEGIALAKARGAFKGRKPVDQAKLDKAQALVAGGMPITRACRQVGIAVRTYYYRVVDKKTY